MGFGEKLSYGCFVGGRLWWWKREDCTNTRCEMCILLGLCHLQEVVMFLVSKEGGALAVLVDGDVMLGFENA